jgi:hypothetical protein
VADNASDTGTGPTSGDTGAPTPPPEGKRARRGGGRSGMRDMLLSMVVLAVAVLALAGITKGCSFSPGGPSVSSGLQPADVTAELQAAAGQVKFPLREPHLPRGWHANSDSVDSLGPKGSDQALRIGWITAGGRYVQLSQSNGSVADLVRSAAGLDNDTSVQATGTQVVDGTKWTVYPGVRSESSWATDLGTVRLFITGNGTTNEFRTMAAAILTGQHVKAAGGP